MEPSSSTLVAPEWTSAPSAIQSRVLQLQDRVEGCRQRIEDQNRSVVGVCRGVWELQAQAAAIQGTLDDLAQRLQALEAVASPPDPVVCAPQAAEPVPPAPEVPPGGETAGQNSAGGLLRCIPYLLIAAAGIGYGLTSRTVEAAAPVAAAVPEPRRPSGESLAVAGAPAAGDPENEALRLVYEYRLPGTDEDMLDLVGAQEDALGPSPWEIECDESHRCDVSFISRVGGGARASLPIRGRPGRQGRDPFPGHRRETASRRRRAEHRRLSAPSPESSI